MSYLSCPLYLDLDTSMARGCGFRNIEPLAGPPRPLAAVARTGFEPPRPAFESFALEAFATGFEPLATGFEPRTTGLLRITNFCSTILKI